MWQGLTGAPIARAEGRLRALRAAAGVKPPTLLERGEEEGELVLVGGSTRSSVVSQASTEALRR